MTSVNEVPAKKKSKKLTPIFTYYNIFIQAWMDSSDSCNYASYEEAVKGAINCDPYWGYHDIYRIDLFKDEEGIITQEKEYICTLPSKRGHSTAEYKVLGVKTENGINVLKSYNGYTRNYNVDGIEELKKTCPNLGIYRVKVGFDDNKDITYDYTLEIPIKGVTLEVETKPKKSTN